MHVSISMPTNATTPTHNAHKHQSIRSAAAYVKSNLPHKIYISFQSSKRPLEKPPWMSYNQKATHVCLSVGVCVRVCMCVRLFLFILFPTWLHTLNNERGLLPEYWNPRIFFRHRDLVPLPASPQEAVRTWGNMQSEVDGRDEGGQHAPSRRI